MKKSLVLAMGLALSGFSFAQEEVTTQEFDDIEVLEGWEMVNRSEPLGETGWFQGADDIMVAQAGEPYAYIAANYRNTDTDNDETANTICNYLIMPELGDVETISFYTRSRKASNNFNVYPDRLFLLYSPEGGIETGNCTDDFGDFTETLLVINQDLTTEATYPEGYPLDIWTQFEAEVSGNGRIAFVYYVEDAGFYGTNSNYIGIDTIEWIPAEEDEPQQPENAEKPLFINKPTKPLIGDQ